MNHSSLPEFRFIEEIKRRNVGRVAILYLVVCWLILEPVHVIFHMMEVPVWANRLVVILMAAGFLPVVVFAWVYEMTPDGLKPSSQVPHGQSIRRPTGRKLDLAIIVLLAIALTYFVVDKFWISKQFGSNEVSHEERHVKAIPADSNSIAVLPFADLTEKQDQQYFADGMAEEVTDLLSRIPGLRVIGRTSSFQFRDKAVDVRSIGQTLGAAFVLEGSLRRSGDKVRVTVQLLDTQNGSHLWSNSYNSKVDDLLEVQDSIATGITRALQVTIQNSPLQRGARTNVTAYELYLKGLHLLDAYTQEDLEEASATFQQALKLDPGFARAEVALATTYDYIGENAWLPPKVAFQRAREAAKRALALDKNDAAAHAVLADIYLIHDWDWPSADREMAEAFNLGARDSSSLLIAGRLATTRGDWDKGNRLVRQVIAQDPLNPFGHWILGWQVYARTGRYAEAATSIKKALEIDPKYGSAHYFLAITLLMQGKLQEALDAANQETLEDGQLEASAAIYYAMQRQRDSDAALARAIDRNADLWASAIAKVYAFRQEHDKAMEWLNRAYEQGDEDLYFILGDPLFKSMEADPRYQAFLRRLNVLR